MTGPVLEARGIAKRWKGRDVLIDAAIALEPGTITYLAGRNGSGKTTLMRICAGEIRPDRGRVDFAGLPPDHRPRLHRLARAGLMYLPARPMLSPSFSLRRHFSAFAALPGAGSIDEAVDRARLALHLEENVATLSGGEQRRASAALALVRRPRCLLIDEPLRGVSPLDAEILCSILAELAASGCAVLVTEHDAARMLGLCDRVVSLESGTAVGFDSVEEAAEQLGIRPLADPRTSDRTEPVSPGGRTIPASGAEWRLAIDRGTLRDLEIFEAQPGQLSIFTLLDRTATAAGRARLRRHFQSPPAELAEIVALQAAVRAAAAHPELLAGSPDDTITKEVQGYLASNVDVRGAGDYLTTPIASEWLRFRESDVWAALWRGVTSSIRFLHAMAGIQDRIARLPEARPIAALVPHLAAELDDTSFRRLLAHDLRLGSRDLVGQDRVLRTLHPSTIARLLDAAAELDLIRSLAAATVERGYAFPSFAQAPAPFVRMDGLHHPFVREPVRNDFALGAGETTLFLTGPNMAGKTTYLKAAALSVYLAHLGMGVPAASMTLTPMRALLSSCSTTDNIQLGYSYFFSEVRRVKEAAELARSGLPVFLAFDELFRGTNVKDALDGARLVIAGLSRFENALVAVSSHLAELAGELHGIPTIRFACLDATVREGELSYDFLVKPGVSAQRLGLHVLEKAGVAALLGMEPASLRSSGGRPTH